MINSHPNAFSSSILSLSHPPSPHNTGTHLIFKIYISSIWTFNHFFNICAKYLNISLYILRLSLSYIFYLINLIWFEIYVGIHRLFKVHKKAICVISRIKRLWVKKKWYVLCTLGIWIVFVGVCGLQTFENAMAARHLPNMRLPDIW